MTDVAYQIEKLEEKAASLKNAVRLPQSNLTQQD